MSEIIEQSNCSTPNENCKLCWTCQRNKPTKKDNQAEFAPKKTLMNGWECDGYVSENQGNLFG